MSRIIRPEDLIDLAKEHGEDSGQYHEIGDLQELLRAAFSIMTPAQFKAFSSHSRVQCALESMMVEDAGEIEVVKEEDATAIVAPPAADYTVLDVLTYAAQMLDDFKPEALRDLGLDVLQEKVEGILPRATELFTKNLYVATFHHRHGVDIGLVLAKEEPSEEEIVAMCEFDLDEDASEGDERIEVDHFGLVKDLKTL